MAEAASRKSRYIIGLMSGTSLDGLDIAYCEISGTGTETKVNILAFQTYAYEAEYVNNVKKVFAQDQVDLRYLTQLNGYIAIYHANIIKLFLEQNAIHPQQIDCIASHGQTIMHVPPHMVRNTSMHHGTLQLGDGDHLAVLLGIPVISDFRQKHIASGGEGAPLAVYGDYYLLGSDIEHRLLINIGGISNFTFIPKKNDNYEVFVTDVGPGNTMIDNATLKFFGKKIDYNGDIAQSGLLNKMLLSSLMSAPIFDHGYPLSTGPELFNLDLLEWAMTHADIHDMSPKDIINTLTHFTVECIYRGCTQFLSLKPLKVYINGGGWHNKYMMNLLQQKFGEISIVSSDVLGIPSDAKEAVLFAVLANETLAGSSKKISTSKFIPPINMGKISLPE